MSSWISRTVVICGAVALSLGCGEASENARDVSATEVEEEIGDVGAAAAGYAATKRRELAERARLAFDDVERELSEARDSLTELPAEMRRQLEDAIDRAEQARKNVGRELDELQQAGSDRWQTAQGRVSNALEEMAEARREITRALSGNEESADAS